MAQEEMRIGQQSATQDLVLLYLPDQKCKTETTCTPVKIMPITHLSSLLFINDSIEISGKGIK